jgi:protein-tyrosine kinase
MAEAQALMEPKEQGFVDISSANWEGRVLHPDENAVLSRLEPATGPALASIPTSAITLRIERTPTEFSHLYAALERQVSGVSEVTLLTAETLGAQNPYVLGVTSAVPGEGKTTTALHLAMTVARHTFKRVCLIDLSLGRGDISARLGIPAIEKGLIQVLEDLDNVVPTLQLTGIDNLVVIPAGRAPANAAKLARSPRIAQMIVSVRHTFDVIIVDLPAVSLDNTLPLSRHLDGVLMVVRAGVTPSDVVSRAIDTLHREKVVGVTMNRSQNALPGWLARLLSGA